MNQCGELTMWTVYDNPADLLGVFVARKSIATGAHVGPTEEVLMATTLQALRQQLPMGLYRIQRHPSDERQIVEVWL